MVKIAAILDEEPGIRDAPARVDLPRIEGDLDIDHIVFAYGVEPVLNGVEIRVPPGGCLALVGESGGGKSTLARFVGRFYDPDSGAVRVDGVDLREREAALLPAPARRRAPGPVPVQRHDRLEHPLCEAGRDGRRGARGGRGGRRRPGRARLSRGLEHEVREGGSGLSAGERQLISIARALLADPRILILDEATSNIDRPTEVLIEHALDRLLRGRTSIIIAHRLSTVRRAGEILVLEHGRIVQRGTERELLARGRPLPPASPTASTASSRRSSRAAGAVAGCPPLSP